MTEAYKCDKCGEYTDFEMKLGLGDGSHWGEAQEKDHLCKKCHGDFEEFMRVGR